MRVSLRTGRVFFLMIAWAVSEEPDIFVEEEAFIEDS